MKTIWTQNAPEAIGPYSQALVGNGFLFGSGQIAIDPDKKAIIAEGIEEQTRQVLENIKAVLTAAGMDLQNIIKTTVYLTDMANFQGMNRVYIEQFGGHKPARATVQVGAIPLNGLIQLDYVAVTDLK